jgi:hypothetical protein
MPPDTPSAIFITEKTTATASTPSPAYRIDVATWREIQAALAASGLSD